MSHTIDEVYKVYCETLRVAAKDHVCSACTERIRKGDEYFTISIIDADSSAESLKRCARCQKIHKHLRSLDPGELWPDEQLNCGEGYREHWQVDPPAEIAALAFALPGEIDGKSC